MPPGGARLTPERPAAPRRAAPPAFPAERAAELRACQPSLPRQFPRLADGRSRKRRKGGDHGRAIREDETVEANGQTFKGPFRLIEDGDLYEISIVPLGADGSTSAQIAASHNKEGKTDMSTQADNTPQTPEQIRAAAVAEQTRIQAVRNETKDHPDLQAKAVAEGWTVERAQFEVIKAERDELLGRNRLTARQARRLNEIRTELDSLPYGESKLEFDARRIIRDAAKTLEKKWP